MDNAKHQFKRSEMVSPPPEVWDNILKRIQKERRMRILRFIGVILIVGMSAGLGIYRISNKSHIFPSPVASTQVKHTEHRHYVEIARDLDEYRRRYPHNPILKLRRRAIESKLNEYTTLTSSGVWRW